MKTHNIPVIARRVELLNEPCCKGCRIPGVFCPIRNSRRQNFEMILGIWTVALRRGCMLDLSRIFVRETIEALKERGRMIFLSAS